LNESFVYSNEKINIPILAHCGKDDHEANLNIMKKWSDVTEDTFSLREFEGGHFFTLELGELYKHQLIIDIMKE
jgi:surfactin synthase thioesterase subunit